MQKSTLSIPAIVCVSGLLMNSHEMSKVPPLLLYRLAIYLANISVEIFSAIKVPCSMLQTFS